MTGVSAHRGAMDVYASGSARSSVEAEIGGLPARGGLLSGRANARRPATGHSPATPPGGHDATGIYDQLAQTHITRRPQHVRGRLYHSLPAYALGYRRLS